MSIRSVSPARRRIFPLAASIALLLPALWPASAKAQTWLASPGSGDWNTAANWSPATVPNSGSATAVFGTSSVNAVSLSSGITVGGITFNGTTAYTISTNNFNVGISGAGVSNTSGLTQTIDVSGPTLGVVVDFTNSATGGGSNVVYNISGAGSGSPSGQTVIFQDTTTLGAATYNVNGILEIDASASGGTAQIVNNGVLVIESDPGSVSIGSLAGSGTVVIGQNGGIGATAQTLTVGSLNTNTTFSGVIQEGGFGPTPATGTLVKVGTGTLTLSGANTYTGGTTISGGVLQIGGGGTTGSIVGNVTDNASLVFDRSNSYTFNGVIGGTGSVTQSGTGTLVLGGANTYAGGTAITGGTLAISSDGNLGNTTGGVSFNGGTLETTATLSSARTITLSGAGTIAPDTATTLTWSGQITGTGSLAMNGPGKLILSNVTNNYSGGTTFDAGTLSISSDAELGSTTGTGLTFNGGTLETSATLLTSRNMNLTGNGTLLVDSGTTLTAGGMITGAGGLTKAGAGLLVLTAANSYAGGTTISAGTLADGIANALPTSGALTDNGTLDLASFNQQVGSVNGSGTIRDSGTAATFTVTGGGTFSGNITGANTALTVGGTSQTLTLSGNNTYGGLTTISSTDTLKAGSTTALTSATSVSASGTLDLNGNSVSIGALNGSGSVSNSGGAGTLTVTGGGTFSGGISGSNTALTVLGPSHTLTLSGSNTYAGVTTVTEGVLSVSSLANGGSASNIGAATSAASNLVLNGGTLQYTGSSVTIDRGLTASNNSVIDVSTSGQTLTMSGAVNVNGGGSGGSGLTIEGNLTLTGTVSLDNSPNSNNALNIAAGATLTTSGTVTNPAGNNVFQGGTLIVNGGTFTTSSITALGNAPGITGSTLTVASGVFDQTTGAVSQFLLGQSAAGTVNLNGGTFETAVQLQSFVAGNALNFNGGTLQLSASLANLVTVPSDVTMTVNSGGAVIDVNGHTLTISNALLAGTGSGGLTVNSTAGGGTLTLSGASSYAGTTTINSGAKIADGIANALPTATALSVSGTLDLAGFNQRVASVTGSGSVTNSSGTAATFTVNPSGTDTFAGTMTGSKLALSVGGTGTLVLTGGNTYGGSTTITAGNLTLGDGSTPGASVGSAGVTVSGGATFTLDLANGETFSNGISDGGHVVADDTPLGNYTISSTITGTGDLTKSGTNTVTLTGANSYQGGTTVSGGTLLIGNATGSATGTGLVTVDSGATLGGVGTISGAVTVNSGGTLAPGDAPGTLNVGPLTLNSGSNSNFQLGAPGVIGGGVNDLVSVTGNLTLAGTLNVTNAGGFGPGGYQLFQYTGSLTNNGLAIGTLPGGYTSANTLLVTGVPGQVDLLVVPNGGAATTQFWDDGVTTGDGTIHGGTGTWSNFSTNFTNAAGTTNAGWQNDIAVFSTPSNGEPASVVTLSGAINFTGLMFTGGNYTIVSDNNVGTSFTALGTPSNANNLATVSVSSGVTATIAAVMGGTAGISMSGGGTLVLDSANTYSGGTTISAGTIEFNNNAGLGTGGITLGDADTGSANVALLATAAMNSDNGGTVGGGAITNNITVSANGTGTATIGTTSFSPSGNGGFNSTTFTGTLMLDRATTLQGGNGDGTTFNGIISGNVGTLTIDGGGRVLMAPSAGDNTFTGNVQVTGSGTILQLDGANNTLNGNSVDLGSGTTLYVAKSTGAESIDALTGSGAVSTNSGASQTLTIGDNGGGGTYSGVISDGNGTLAIVKSGSGTEVLTGASTYSGGTEVGGGTLQLGDGVTTGASLGSGSVTVDTTGTLTFALASGETFSNAITDNGHVIADFAVATNNYTIASNISGTGDFTKNDANTVTLTGNNTYQGGTTINGGTLLVNNTAGSGTGSGTVMVGAGSTLGGSGTISGPVTMNGTVAPGAGSIGTAGTTLHAGAVTWNGGATLSLQLGAGGVSDMLAINGALTKGSAGTYSINLSDVGINQSTYELASYTSTNFLASDFSLALPGSYTGVLAVTGTQLDIILAFATNGSIIDNAAPINTPTFADFTVNGPVYTAGGNNFIHTLTFTPGSSLQIFNTLYVTQGPVILVGGSTLTLNGNLSTSLLEMLYGSLLKGNGSILGNVINSGVISPGNSPGIIRMSGNLTETPTGTLQIQIGGKDISQHDLLAVNGTATLGGTLQLQQLNDFKLHRNDSITFLTANGGINGRFSMVENGFARTTILEPTVVYSSNSVALEAQQGAFKEFAANENLTPNQQAVGGMLDSAVNDHRANALINYMDGRILSKLPSDLAKISPDALTSVCTIGTALATVQSQNLQRRTDDIRSGSSGFNAANLAINGDGPNFSGRFSMEPGWAGPNGNDGKDMTANKEVQPVAPAESRWGAFLSGTGDWVSVGDTNNARGYDLESGGFTVGVDYKVCPNFAIGLMAGYTGTTSNLPNNGRIYVNGGKVGVYATTFVGGWYADAAAFGGYDSYDTRRPALQGDARGSTEGGNVDAMIGTGYDFKAGVLTFGPTATFNYTYTGTSEFNEYGSLAPLDIHGGHSDSLRSAFGVKASYDWKVGGVVIKPEVRAAWQHEYGDAAYALDSSLASGAGSTFTVNGPKLGRDSLLLGAGVAIQCSESVSTYFYYDGELGRTNYESNAVTGGIRVAF